MILREILWDLDIQTYQEGTSNMLTRTLAD